MPINPAIAMGVQPIQLADPLSQYGKVAAIQQAQNQNALAQYQLGAAQREELAQNALSEAYKAAYNPQTGTYDINKLRGAVIGAGAGARLPDIEKKMGELRTQQLTQQKAETELVDSKLKQSRQLLDSINPADPNAPAQYIAWHEANHRDPVLGPMLAARGVTAQQSRARIENAIARGPQAFADLLDESKLGVEKFAELNKPHFVTQDTNNEIRVLAIPGRGGAGAVVPGSVLSKTLTPEQALPKRTKTDLGGAIITEEYDPVTRTSKIVDRQLKSLTPEQARTASQEATKVAHTTTDEAGNVTLYNMFGKVIGAQDATGAPVAIKGKPGATFEKTRAQREQLQKDLGTAIRELTDVTAEGGLIDQSTGSGAGRLVDIGARFVGKAMPGDIAISKLKPIADLPLKLIPRFEGPQSDKDTASYKEAAGQLADPTLPREVRKAAGKTVLRLLQERKGQFVSEGMATEGVGPGGGVDTSNPLLK